MSHDDITIRSYQSEDFPIVIEIWSATGLGGAQRGDNQQVIEQSIDLGGCFLVAETSTGEVIGTSWVTFDGRRLHLHHFGVLPAWQQKGVGNILTKATLDFAKQKGYQIKLEVHRSNTAAINLYKKFGFSYLGDYDVYIIRDVLRV